MMHQSRGLKFIVLSAIVSLSSALQSCHRVDPKRVDICFAVSSYKNHTTDTKDVSIHFSARFEGRKGWAAVGIGGEMKGGLMVVMYPGVKDGDVTTSIRTAPGHVPPEVMKTTSFPVIHVTRTWVSTNGIHNTQLLCYDCESWAGSELDVESSKQKWIWSANFMQETQSEDPELMLNIHTDRGIATLNMESSYEKNPEGEVVAQVSEDRISTNDEPAEEKHHHKHKTFGLVSIHGILLTISFMSLSGGILAIRSGITNSFKMHWVVQSTAGGGIVVGCLMGIWMSFAHGGHFSTFHQMIGLTILPGIIAQGLLGYWHHINYVKLGRRTAISNYHVWVGRAVLAVGNINVGLGLNLAHASSLSFHLYFSALILQLAILLPMWYFWSRGLSITDVLEERGQSGSKRVVEGGGRGGEEYVSVEQDPFIIDEDDILEDELDGDGERGKDLEIR
ncbi:hypothetical protein WAI453_003065 [Rhynchosporium graminicola]